MIAALRRLCKWRRRRRRWWPVNSSANDPLSFSSVHSILFSGVCLHHHHSKCRWLLAKLVINYSLTISSTAARPHWLALMLLHFDQVCVPFLFGLRVHGISCFPFSILSVRQFIFNATVAQRLPLILQVRCNCGLAWPGLVWWNGEIHFDIKLHQTY